MKAKAKEVVKMALIILAALLLAALAGVLVTNADGPMIWKMHCPAHYDVVTMPAADWGGVHVMCIRAAVDNSR